MQLQRGGRMTDKETIEVLKNDCYLYYNCVTGNCPRIIEEKIYGVITSTCNNYGCNKFYHCNECYFDGSDMCENCIHKNEVKENDEQRNN